MHFATITLLSLALNAAAHGLIVEIGGGAKGVAANGFGVANGAAPTRAEVAVLSSKTGCGSGVDIATNIAAAEKAGLPAPATDGSLAMTWFQLNAGSDGGGPGTAFVDPTGTGNSFVALTISKNFADGGANSKNPMTLQFSASTPCTGGSGSTCLVRVQNPAGPFGSCFAVASPSSAGGSTTSSSAVASSVIIKASAASASTAPSPTQASLNSTGGAAVAATHACHKHHQNVTKGKSSRMALKRRQLDAYVA